MTQYIDKSDIVAEIERLDNFWHLSKSVDGQAFVENLLLFLNTLEVKEVDLEEELKSLIEKEKAFVTDNREVKYYNGDSFNHIYELEFIAKHFFELGLKAQKGE